MLHITESLRRHYCTLHCTGGEQKRSRLRSCNSSIAPQLPSVDGPSTQLEDDVVQVVLDEVELAKVIEVLYGGFGELVGRFDPGKLIRTMRSTPTETTFRGVQETRQKHCPRLLHCCP
ncbi:hypothetical protein ACI65C_003080 [Semiaphis heraclei]